MRPYRYFFFAQLALFVFVMLGIAPRETMLFFTAIVAVLAFRWPLKEGVLFFIQSIPIFVALPLTDSFDNFNAWRLILLVLFVKWLLEGGFRSFLAGLKHPKQHPYALGLLGLLVLAGLSLLSAPEPGTGLMRIIYFSNIAFIGIIIHSLVAQEKSFAKDLIHAIRMPTMIVIAVGFLQVVSTYFIDIYQFMRLWGEGIQCNQFGAEWCFIAVNVGNTWFAYFGEQLSLRVFSLFPDSHSFPQFVLLGIPALLAHGVSNITAVQERLNRWKSMVLTRGRLAIVWVPAGFLMAILSGTRGIWAAALGVVVLIFALMALLPRLRASQAHKALFKYVSSYIALFFLLFAVAYPIFTSPQFLLSKGNLDLFGNRIRSIIDFGETSNSQRIEIWKRSVESIRQYPWIGIGIGNFPVVLGQHISLARAGSSAHNVYLHIAAEMGVPALLIAVALLKLFFWQSVKTYLREQDPFLMTYMAGALLAVPWVLAYSLTDVAIFDERAMLLLVATFAMIAGLKRG